MRKLLIVSLLLSAVALAQVTVVVEPRGTAENPTSPFSVLPGASRWLYSNICDGANAIGCTRPANMGLTWSITEGAAGGTITGTGPNVLYTAPNTPGTYHVVATSQQDTNASFTSTVTVITPPTIEVTVVPNYIVLYKGQTIVAQSYVLGAVNQQVTWTATGGTLVSSGRAVGFSSSTAGTYTLTATWSADGTKTGTATIVVTDNAYPDAATANKTEPVDCTCVGSGTCYDVGPSKATYKTLTDVPWNSLNPGDTIRLFNEGTAGSPTTYAVKFSSQRSGTASQPIRVCGVPANNELPRITGDAATTRSDNTMSSSLEGYGIFQVAGPSAGPSTKYWVIEGLDIRNARTTLQYHRQSDGALTSYLSEVSCLRVNSGWYFTIRGNDIQNCDNGLFTGSQPPSQAGTDFGVRMTMYFLVQGNHFAGNGRIEGVHNTYLQAFGSVVQGNLYDEMASNALGSQIKSRVPGVIIRYNYFVDAVAALDAIVWFNAPDTLNQNGTVNEAYYQATLYAPPYDVDVNRTIAFEEWAQNNYFYGNIIKNGKATLPFRLAEPGSTNLYFYHNTYWDTMTTTPYETALFWGKPNYVDGEQYQCDGTVVPTSACTNSLTGNVPVYYHPSPRVTNNAIWRNAANTTTRPYFEWSHWFTTRVVLDKNWIAESWGTGCNKGSSSNTGCGTAYMVNAIPGSDAYQTSIDSPHVQNASGTLCHAATPTSTCGGVLVTGSSIPFSQTSFVPETGSPLIAAAQTLPEPIATLAPVTYQYNPTTYLMAARSSAADIGALDSGTPVDQPATTGASIGGGAAIGGGVVVQ